MTLFGALVCRTWGVSVSHCVTKAGANFLGSSLVSKADYTYQGCQNSSEDKERNYRNTHLYEIFIWINSDTIAQFVCQMAMCHRWYARYPKGFLQ